MGVIPLMGRHIVIQHHNLVDGLEHEWIMTFHILEHEFYLKSRICNIYDVVDIQLPSGCDCYIAMVKPWPIEIDGLPMKKVWFSINGKT